MTEKTEPQGGTKLLIDLGPLLIFFLVNFFAPVPSALKIFVATGAFMVAMVVFAPALDAQMAHRLKGSIRSVAGVPLVNATVRADAITGFRGEPFAGAKEQSATTIASGEWNITGLEAGLWMFSTVAPDMLPAVLRELVD